MTEHLFKFLVDKGRNLIKECKKTKKQQNYQVREEQNNSEKECPKNIKVKLAL